MGHLVLYRHFRPQNFDEVIGQDHIVKTLKNQVLNNSFGHAYLFCGTRGTGKTSTARIFARAINCLNNQDGSPCGKCENCLSNLNGGNLDIIEIDAASNNRVDEIRDLREKIGYLPSVNKYKVYIIDEVHMLTDSAFNALLKTLEEPPQHAIFILGTTEPHKLPATILSRCMRFDFKLVSIEDLAKHLQYIFDKVGIKYDQESLKLISESGNGSVRDTLSVAEMCAAYSNNEITYKKCLECLGITDTQTLIDFLTSFVQKDTSKLLELFSVMKKQGKNYSVLVNDLIKSVNNLLSIKLSNNAFELLGLPKDVFEKYYQVANQSDSLRLVELLKVLTELDGELKLATNPEMLVEAKLLSKILEQSEIEDLKTRFEELEKKSNDGFIILKKNETISENIEKNAENNKKNDNFQEKIELTNQENNENNSIDAKILTGKLVNILTKKHLFMVKAMLSDVVDVELKNNILTMYVQKQTLENIKKNYAVLKSCLNEIDAGIDLELLEATGDRQKDIDKFLKTLFDNIEIID